MMMLERVGRPVNVDVVGWLLVGPMVAVCAADAPDEDAARAHANGWVGQVVPLYAGRVDTYGGDDPVLCVACGREIA